MKKTTKALLFSLFMIRAASMYGQTCGVVNTVPKSTGPTSTTCSEITDDGSIVGVAVSGGTTYFQTSTSAPNNTTKLFVDMSQVPGNPVLAGLMIKGNTTSDNWPTIGLSMNNRDKKTILGATLMGQITSNTTGSETMDLEFLTKPFNNQVLERMRITSAGHVGINTTTPANILDVNGAVAIGSSYAGASTAPANGLIAQGNVGVGTSAPVTKLDVNGQALWLEGGNGGYLTGAGEGLNLHYDAASHFGHMYAYDYTAHVNKNLIIQTPDLTNSNVGIGVNLNLTLYPLYDRLDVGGTVRVQNLPATTTPGGIVFYGPGSSGQSNQLQSLPLSGSSTDVLHGDGTWAPGGGGGSGTAYNGLSNDGSGNVVLGEDICDPSTPAQLKYYREVPLNDFSINFTDNETLLGNPWNPGNYSPFAGSPNSQGRIGIGLTCKQEPGAKLDIFRPTVVDEVNPIGLRVINSDQSSAPPTKAGINGAYGCDISADNGYNENNYGGHFVASNAEQNWGVWGQAMTAPAATAPHQTNDRNIGGAFQASNNFINTGVSGIVSNGSEDYGVYGYAGNGNDYSDNFGGYFLADGIANSSNAVNSSIGIYASNFESSFGIGNPNDCAGYFDGDVVTVTGGTFSSSDEKLKTNIQDFKNSLDMLKKLNAKTYDFKADEFKNSMNLPRVNQIGIMAQNLQAVFPNLVKEKLAPAHRDPKTHKALGTDTKFLAVNYTGLIPVLVEAVNELDAKTEKINALQTALENTNATITALQNQINDLCNGGCASLKGSNNDQGNSLLQNVPNPFSQQTAIGYVLNVGTTAYMNINSLDGKLIKRVDLTVKGAGSVIINSNEMNPGTYTYSLNVDGKVIDTKIMVITAQD